MVKKALLLSFGTGLIILIVWVLVLNRPVNKVSTEPIQISNNVENAKIEPSENLKVHTDVSGFSFSYPDNLSLENKEIEDDSVYANLQLFTPSVSGSLNLKISDSKFKTIGEWVKTNSLGEAPKEKKLGSIAGVELKLKDRLLFGSIDQGILFTIEMPLVEEDFWMKVYEKILADFTFVAQSAEGNSSGGSSGDVTFEGEEVVE